MKNICDFGAHLLLRQQQIKSIIQERLTMNWNNSVANLQTFLREILK